LLRQAQTNPHLKNLKKKVFKTKTKSSLEEQESSNTLKRKCSKLRPKVLLKNKNQTTLKKQVFKTKTKGSLEKKSQTTLV
jgi:hypothetical protein